ncbi:MAG: methionyl-tRNA formyltransferase [Planctomycetes bacterium]|nr:methionyl-tRNA formyltransferase [Planctomycetota bacterium]
MRLVFFGSGAFGLPTLRHLMREHEVALVIAQPDRPAGRRRTVTPTPVAAFARDHGLPVLTPPNVNEPAVLAVIRALSTDAWVVIAYGQKLSNELLADRFVINLHGSILPKYRGAAPINRAMMDGERETGVSVITVVERMDAGDVLAVRRTPIDPMETAGELHDRLAELGPEAVGETLDAHAAGMLAGQPQDHALATKAPKMSRDDGTVRFDQTAAAVRCRVHGLTPWPGCTVRVGEATLKLLRVSDEPECAGDGPAGEILADGRVRCAPGAVRLLSVQPPGKKAMTFDAYRRGHRVPDDALVGAT